MDEFAPLPSATKTGSTGRFSVLALVSACFSDAAHISTALERADPPVVVEECVRSEGEKAKAPGIIFGPPWTAGNGKLKSSPQEHHGHRGFHIIDRL